MKRARVFHQIDPHNQGCAVSQHAPGVAQEGHGFLRLEIPDGRSGKEPGMRHRRRCGGQSERLGEIGLHRKHRKARIVAPKLVRLLNEHLGGDINRNIGRNRRNGRQQYSDLPT